MGSRRKGNPPVIIGVGVVVQRDNSEVLMVKRKKTHGEGEWAVPGGKVRYGETFGEAARRELREETGLEATSTKVISLSNQLRYLEEGVHCVIIGVMVEIPSGAGPQIMEPHKCEAIDWFGLDELPPNIFEGTEQIFSALKGRRAKITFIEE